MEGQWSSDYSFVHRFLDTHIVDVPCLAMWAPRKGEGTHICFYFEIYDIRTIADGCCRLPPTPFRRHGSYVLFLQHDGQESPLCWHYPDIIHLYSFFQDRVPMEGQWSSDYSFVHWFLDTNSLDVPCVAMSGPQEGKWYPHLLLHRLLRHLDDWRRVS